MRLMLIVNTSASSVTARARVVIQKALAADHEVLLRETKRRGHATHLARGAAADGLDAAVVLGGDGTLNEAANGLAQSATSLAVLPGGSTNVFARTIGVVNDPIEATSQLLTALADGPPKQIGLGQLNGRYFLFHAGIGFDAAVVARVERLSLLKRYVGPAVFVTAALSTWARGYDRQRPTFSLETAGQILEDGYFSVCLNTDPYTYLGTRALSVAPGTSLQTPLSLVTFQRLTLGALLPVIGAALRGGARVQSSRHVSFAANVHQATVRGHRPVPYQLDGDYLGESGLIELRWAPDALRVVLPSSNEARLDSSFHNRALDPE